MADAAEALAISMRDVHRTYGRGEQAVRAVRGASLDVVAGEVVAVSGASGSGKTTLLNCLVGLDKADEGTITALGTDVTALGYEEAVTWRRDQVAIVFQSAGLLPHLTAWENVDVVLRLRGVERHDRLERVDEVLDRLGVADFRNHRPNELSGGQQQRVSLARALASRPPLLIADEPTGQLDTETTQVILDELRQLGREHSITMVMATHDRDVEHMADRAVHMRDGAIVEDPS